MKTVMKVVLSIKQIEIDSDLRWRIRKRPSANEVIVEVVDYEGPLAASGQDVRLRKNNNEWIVISRRGTWVS